MSLQKTIRVRFAPSPTGPLHIGGVRTALYNYLFAKKHGGQCILRIEDTDSGRFVPGAEAYIIDALAWLGIRFDEGTVQGGPFAPYRQSERKAIYKTYVDQLISEGKAYIAFDTPAQLDQKRAEISNFQYDAGTRMQMINSLTCSAEAVQARMDRGEPYVVRFKVEPDQEVRISDLIRGEVSFQSNVLDDKVLFKSADQLPTYHLANIVDDHLMDISHVIRGEEWLPSAPLHVLLYKALGWEHSMPSFAHLPLLLKPEGNGKLSKRDGDRLGFPVFPCDWTDPKTGDKSSGYREAGYFPEAVINFLALLGWNPGDDQEVRSMEELIRDFSLEKCSKSGARFDYEKGKWFNHQYLLSKTPETLAEAFRETLISKGFQPDANEQTEFNATDSHISMGYIVKAIALVKERATFVSDFWEQAGFFFERPNTYAEKNVKKFWKADTADLMQALYEQLNQLDCSDPHATETAVMDWINRNEYKTGAVMNAFRLSLVGESKGPHLFDIVALLGKKESLLRLKQAIETLK